MMIDQATRFSRKVTLQRLAMLWERLWQALYWPLIAAGITIAVLASGVLQSLPLWARFASLGLLGILCVASLYDLARLAVSGLMPGEWHAMRRIEQEAGLTHRTVSSSGEDLVPELGDETTRALWLEHKRRQLSKLDNVPVSPPRSAWRAFDPRALRVPVALAALASFVLGAGDVTSNLKDAVTITTPPPPVTVAIDAWLRPPGYTGKPPLLMTSPAMKEKLAQGLSVAIPVNSTLTARVTGAAAPTVVFQTSATDATPVKDITAKTKASETGFSAEAKITANTVIRILDGEKELAAWPVEIIADQPPTIAITKPPAPEKLGALALNWEATDDYGVKSITSEIGLADEQDGGIGFEGNGPFLFDPPKFPVAMKKPNAKKDAGKATQDMTAHPWAGLNVEIVLTAKDAAGQTTATQPVQVKLPERTFFRPLAKALIEQRKRLILSPDNASDVALLFRTLLKYPVGLIERSGHQIRLASISSALANSGDNDEIIVAINDLWQLAVEIEDGSLADAKAELAELKKLLEEALRNGASPEEIKRLMDKMREAMNRYLDEMRKQAEKNMQAGREMPRSDREVSRQDLQRMMDEIEKLSKDGARDMAQQLLDELDQMLQNLQPGGRREAGQPGDELGEMMDQLSDLMRQQQRLMDQTQRMQQGEQGEQGEGQQGENGQGQNGQGQMGENGQGQMGRGGQTPGGLADRQGQLRDLLDRLQRELGGDAPGDMGEAGRQMQGAEESLRGGDRDNALRQQRDALNALRNGARQLAQRMQERGQGQARNQGRDGEAGGEDDPLGRPRATRNPDEGPEKDMLPTDLAIRKAREILEMLRSRANEQGLTETERGYIDRLLRGLY
jgi:uncharacterized protein (TIGR02302 family)